MTDRLYFTDSDEANALLVSDPMALLVGFVLDQQVSVQKAFSGPLVIKERLGTLDAETLAAADLEPVFRERPAIHRFPGSMAKRVQALCAHVAERYDGDASRIWTQASTPEELRRNLETLPGFGQMKVDSTAAVYLANDTAIVPVLRHIFNSTEFLASRDQKARRPFEHVVACLRALRAAAANA